MAKRNFKSKFSKTCDCGTYKDTDVVVQPGLSLTPRDVKSLTERGIAVSTPNISYVSDPDAGFGGINPIYKRGCDLNTAWEITQKSQQSLIENYQYSKRLNTE